MPGINVNFIGILFLTLFLSACGIAKKSYREFAPDRDTVYLDAQLTEPLALPEGVAVAYNPHSPYILPQGPLPAQGAEPLNLIPPGGRAVWDEAKAEVAREEGEQGKQDS